VAPSLGGAGDRVGAEGLDAIAYLGTSGVESHWLDSAREIAQRTWWVPYPGDVIGTDPKGRMQAHWPLSSTLSFSFAPPGTG
jgi:hypothetical protein